MPLTAPFDAIKTSTTLSCSSIRPQWVEISVRDTRVAPQLVPIDNPHIDLHEAHISTQRMCRNAADFPAAESAYTS
ncbi:MAG: hypothetical protein P8L39_06580 [Halioglobus sp.]|nr:hypothetical protein [Halioglobus sp.]